MGVYADLLKREKPEEKEKVEGMGDAPYSELVAARGKRLPEMRSPEPIDPQRGPLGQGAYGMMEGFSNVAGMLLPGISGEEIQQKLRSPNVFPENIAPPQTGLEKTARFTGQQLGGTAAVGPLAAASGLLRGGAGMVRGLGKEGLYKGIASEGAYSLGGGVGQAIGSDYGPSGELSGSLIGMAVPPLLRAGFIRGMRGEFVGGDAGFNEFRNNRRIFENAGIEVPSLGVVSPKVRSIEASLESVPGTHGVFHRQSVNVYKTANDNMMELRRSVSFEDSAGAAGEAIKEGLLGSPTRKGWIDKFKSEAHARYAQIDALIGPQTLVEAPAFSVKTGIKSGVGTPMSPATSAFLEENYYSDPKLKEVIDSLKKDAAQYQGKIPYQTLQDARSWVGSRLTSTDFISSTGFPRAEYKQAYKAISESMRKAAVSNGAIREFDRANRYWANNIETVDGLASVLAEKGASPERLYTWAMADSGLGASRISDLRSRLTRGQFDVVRSAAMRRMGFPAENVADDFGPDFQPLRFLKNYEKMDPAARDAMFGGINVHLKGASVNLKGAMDAIADAGRLMKEAGGVMANPSGTAGRGLNAATLWAVAIMLGGGVTGALGGSEVAGSGREEEGASFGGVGGLLAAGVITRTVAKTLFTNPKFITWLAEAQKLPPQRIPGHIGRLSEIMTDPESTAAIQAYTDLLMQANVASAEQTMRNNNAVVR